MSAVGCIDAGTNDGVFRATQKVFGAYDGTPSGSVPLVIISTAEIRAAGPVSTVVTTSLVEPDNEPTILAQIVIDSFITCPQPHNP